MSRQRARTYFKLFAAIALSVTANLFLFQPRLGSQAVPETSAGGGEAKPVKVAAAHPAHRQRSPEQISETTRAIQRELKELGHYPGQVDGRLNQLTYAAVLSYEQQNGLPLSGEPSERLLKILIVGLGAVPEARVGGPGLVQGSPAEKIVADVRALLSSLGYNTGRSDGRLSLELIKAIRSYEADNGLTPQTGRINATLLLHLQRKLAAFKPR